MELQENQIRYRQGNLYTMVEFGSFTLQVVEDLCSFMSFRPIASANMDSLRESFTTKMATTISSSLTKEISGTRITHTEYFEVIGRGSAGTVFEIPGTEIALKKGSVKASIWADSQMTNLACTAVMECKRPMERYFPGISVPRVPRVKDWVKEEDMEAWWGKNGDRFVNVGEGY